MTPTPEQFDALADAMNAALNNHYHDDQCACDAWPAACLSKLGRYRPGEWDTGAFAIVLPLVWDEIARVATEQRASHGGYCTVGLCGWRRVHAERYERVVDGVTWALDDLDDTEIGPDDPGAGWYLYGPGSYAEGRFLVASDAVPTVGADAVIRTHTYLACDCCGRVGEVRDAAGIRLCVGNTTGLAGPCPTPNEVGA
ncbi:hypothetical protein [Embleya sp. NPDC020630]|uniref:hypothetical protein n=1 Tax=Embleya sp. NPDC020630 TaxID=3363979 RepID=UPI0037971DB0